MFFFFYCVEIQSYSRSKTDMYFTYSPLEAAAGLVALSSLLNSNICPFSPSPLHLKWPEFENHLLSGWDVLTVFFQFLVAGTFGSLVRAHGCLEPAPGSWDPACEGHGLPKSVCSGWCRNLCWLKPESSGGKYPTECLKEGMLERLWLSRHLLLALWFVLPPLCFCSLILLPLMAAALEVALVEKGLSLKYCGNTISKEIWPAKSQLSLSAVWLEYSTSICVSPLLV